MPSSKTKRRSAPSRTGWKRQASADNWNSEKLPPYRSQKSMGFAVDRQSKTCGSSAVRNWPRRKRKKWSKSSSPKKGRNIFSNSFSAKKMTICWKNTKLMLKRYWNMKARGTQNSSGVMIRCRRIICWIKWSICMIPIITKSICPKEMSRGCSAWTRKSGILSKSCGPIPLSRSWKIR